MKWDRESMQDADHPYVDHIVRVRFAETDLQGIVYYTNYLVWFEVGRMEWMRAHGITWKDLEAIGQNLIIARAEIDYHASATYDDEVRVRTYVERVGNKSVTFGYQLHLLPGALLLATGKKVMVTITMDGATVPLPDMLRSPLELSRQAWLA
jgi:acyl-CoA thioester hydrolase